MAGLSKNDVVKVAKLAKLSLTPSQISKFTKQLSEVVNFVGELDKVETEGTLPTSQTTGLENVFRTDELKPDAGLSQETALSGTEEVHNGYFKVAAIFEREEKK